MEARPIWSLVEVLAILGGGARWSSTAEHFPFRARGPVRPLCAFPSPRISARRIRLNKVKELVLKHDADGGGAGCRLSGAEDRRLPVRREASSDPRLQWRSSGGAPSARPLRRPQRRVAEGLGCNLIFVGDLSVIPVL